MTIEKNELVEQYIPLANKLAYQKKKSLPKHIDVEELKSAAYLGLVEAADRFNDKMGVCFSTFAYPRIFGAIQDYLRELGWGKRGEQLKAVSLDCENSAGQSALLKSKEAANQEEMLEVISLHFNSRAKEVLRTYFIDEKSMKEIGQKFNVSESRISQLLKQCKSRIRKNWTRESLYTELAA